MQHLPVRSHFLRSPLVRVLSYLLSLSVAFSYIVPALSVSHAQNNVRLRAMKSGNSENVNELIGNARDSFASRRKQPEYVPGEVLVRFREAATPSLKTKAKGATFDVMLQADYADESQAVVGDIAATVENTEGAKIISNLRLARVDEEDTLAAVKRFNRRNDVLYAEPNYLYYPTTTANDPLYSNLYALKNTGQLSGTPGADIRAEQAWDITTGSRNVVVGVIDQGVDIDHPDLRDNIWRNPAETVNGVDDDGNGKIDDTNGWDFFSNDNNPRPLDASESHGTHVAGTIGARGNNGIGITGVNWQVSLMPLRSGNVSSLPSNALLGAYAYAKEMRDTWVSSGGARGANLRVLNNSYGGPGYSQLAFDAIKRLNDSGILFIAAAGNDAIDNDLYPSYPTNYVLPNMISVAATDRNDALAGFSQFGAQTVSLGAPGVSIQSTLPGGGYGSKSGTSMATPQVVGAAALVCAANPFISMAQLRAALLYNGDRINELKGKTSTGRRLNVHNAILASFESDFTAPATITDVRSRTDRRTVTLSFTAPGDDGTTGQAADYNVTFRDGVTGEEVFLPFALLPSPAGTAQTASVNIPYRHFTGTLNLRAIDNLGNSSTTQIPVALKEGSGNDPYTQTISSPEPLSTGGTALGLRADDAYQPNYALPFAFPFYNKTYTSVTISTNGALYFGTAPTGNDAGSSVSVLNAYNMIAGMWDDLRTDGGENNASGSPTNGVYVVQPSADSIIFRWQGVTFNTPFRAGERGENPLAFEIELRRNGGITIRYGTGGNNNRLIPVVGISGGEPDAYYVPQYTSSSLISLSGAASVNYSLRPLPKQRRALTRSMYR